MTLRSPGAMTDDGAPSKPFTAARDGFSLNCAVACDAHDRSKLERVIRYMARPPISQGHLSLDGDGLVVYELKHPFSDATTHVLFEPQDFIARLAASGSLDRAPISSDITHCSLPTPDTAISSCLAMSRPAAPNTAKTPA